MLEAGWSAGSHLVVMVLPGLEALIKLSRLEGDGRCHVLDTHNPTTRVLITVNVKIYFLCILPMNIWTYSIHSCSQCSGNVLHLATCETLLSVLVLVGRGPDKSSPQGVYILKPSCNKLYHRVDDACILFSSLYVLYQAVHGITCLPFQCATCPSA